MEPGYGTIWKLQTWVGRLRRAGEMPHPHSFTATFSPFSIFSCHLKTSSQVLVFFLSLAQMLASRVPLTQLERCPLLRFPYLFLGQHFPFAVGKLVNTLGDTFTHPYCHM